MSQEPDKAARIDPNGLTEDPQGGVLIIDFGAQYCQLIARRVRELGVYSRITVPERAMFTLQHQRPQAIILSGGPNSVYQDDAPALDPAILEQGVPILGICYGLQWLAQHTGGQVTPAKSGAEYGRTDLHPLDKTDLLLGVRDGGTVWMSHGDKVHALGDGFEVLAESKPCPYAVVGNRATKQFGLQFHPEVNHTEDGLRILENFVLGIAKCDDDWNPGDLAERKVEAIRELVGDHGEVVLGLSGGVDSSVAAVLVHRAIGKRLHCVFVDNGLLRQGEREGVEELFRDHYHMDLKVVDGSERFLGELQGVTEPEQKRKIIGRVFVEIFEQESKGYANAGF
ncbi:MAG: glutamine-hydrolyzing GMP synthase, partial [Planctomycetes bacterium]|nr:glutamine-hydrolyzing GMP synthase [Planctomycetota bacterium]